MKATTAERDPQALARLRDLIKDISVAMVITVTPDGALRSRPMVTQRMREEGELWFFTAQGSAMSADIADEPAVNVSYADPSRDRYVSVSGQASLVNDRGEVKKLWDPEMARYFPKGMDDPQLALLRVRIESAEYWDAASRRMAPLGESRQTTHGAGPKEASDHPATDDSEGNEHTKIDIRAARASG